MAGFVQIAPITHLVLLFILSYIHSTVKEVVYIKHIRDSNPGVPKAQITLNALFQTVFVTF